MRLYTESDVLVVADLVRGGLDPVSALVAATDQSLLTDPNLPLIKSVAGHPLRRQIVSYLGEHGPASPSQITRELGEVSLGTVSYHVRRLTIAGVLKRTGTRQRRGALETFYDLME